MKKTMSEIYEYLKQIKYNKSTITVCYLCDYKPRFAILGTMNQYPINLLSELEDEQLTFDIHKARLLKNEYCETLSEEAYEDFRHYNLNDEKMNKYYYESEDPWIWIDKKDEDNS